MRNEHKFMISRVVMTRATVLALFCLMPLTPMGAQLFAATAATTQVAVEFPPLVLFAVRQNEASYDSVKDVSYAFHAVRHNARAPTTQVLDGRAKQQGSLGFQSVDERVMSAQHETDDVAKGTHITAYVGPESSGLWHEHTSFAEEYLHLTLGTMSDHAKRLSEGYSSPHPEKYAFGDGDMFLWEMLDDARQQSTLVRLDADSIEAQGEPRVRLTKYVKVDGKDVIQVILCLDPKRGFLVRRMEDHSFRNGALLREYDTEVSELTAKGTWYPTRILQKQYRAGSDPISSTDLIIRDAVFKPTFAKEDFSVAALRLDVGTQLLRVQPNGDKMTLVRTTNGFDDASTGKRKAEASDHPTRVVTLAPAVAPKNEREMMLVWSCIAGALAVIALWLVKRSQSHRRERRANT